MDSNIGQDVVMLFPVKGGKTWSLSQVKFIEYQNTFPMLNIGQDLREAWQWLMDDEKRLKTNKDHCMHKFIRHWLTVAKEKKQNGYSQFRRSQKTPEGASPKIGGYAGQKRSIEEIATGGGGEAA